MPAPLTRWAVKARIFRSFCRNLPVRRQSDIAGNSAFQNGKLSDKTGKRQFHTFLVKSGIEPEDDLRHVARGRSGFHQVIQCVDHPVRTG